jgi:hypothetical protein
MKVKNEWWARLGAVMRWHIWGHRAKPTTRTDERPNLADLWPSFESDKCDVCPSPAKVRVFIPHSASVLDFCGHHFRKNHKKFDELGYMWIDGRRTHEKFTKTLQDISGKL